MHEWCCLFFFSHSLKHSTWITMSKFDYDNLSNNEKSQKFIKFDKNISDKCCDFFSCIDKNKNMLQIRQKAVTQKEMKISQDFQKFQAGWIIRFVFKNIQIHVNSRKNWNYENSSADLSFSNQKSLLCLWQIKVEIIIDRTEFKWQRISKTENIKKTYNVNKSVSFKLTARYSKYELCDLLDCHIQNNLIRFNSAYEKLEQRLVRIEILQNTSRNWKNKYKITRNDKIYRWKIHQQYWKSDFLKKKYQKKTWIYFHLKSYKETLREQEKISNNKMNWTVWMKCQLSILSIWLQELYSNHNC